MAQNQNTNKEGGDQPGQSGRNEPSNQLHAGSQNKDELNSGAGFKDNPNKTDMKKEAQSEAKHAGLNSDESTNKNTGNKSGNTNGSVNSGI